MNSSHSSKILLVLVAVLVVAGTANAVTITETDAPNTAEVGSSIEATFTFEDLYEEYEEWRLEGETNLTDVTWTVTTRNQADSQIEQASTDGQTFGHDVSINDDVALVEVRLTATVPEVPDGGWSYDPPQQVVVADFQQTREGGTTNEIGDPVTLRPYNDASAGARQAIDDADRAVSNAGAPGDTRETLERAKEEFDKGNFPLAEELANQAADNARSSQERSELLQMAGVGLVALLLLAIIGGGLYWYRSNQTGSKL